MKHELSPVYLTYAFSEDPEDSTVESVYQTCLCGWMSDQMEDRMSLRDAVEEHLDRQHSLTFHEVELEAIGGDAAPVVLYGACSCNEWQSDPMDDLTALDDVFDRHIDAAKESFAQGPEGA